MKKKKKRGHEVKGKALQIYNQEHIKMQVKSSKLYRSVISRIWIQTASHFKVYSLYFLNQTCKYSVTWYFGVHAIFKKISVVMALGSS